MKLQEYRKIVPLASLQALGETCRAAGKTVVHCHGCFDIVHPGHVRYLKYAGQLGDILVVSLTSDDAIEKGDGARPYVPQELRAESLAALEFVDHVVVADGPTAERVIRELRPSLYVKGKEYEGSTHPGFLAEQALVEELGGRVMFSSGDVVFSSTSIIDNLAAAMRDDGSGGFDDAARLRLTCSRWGVTFGTMRRTIEDGFRGKRVVVVGDSLLDRYTFCDPADVSNEAPILSVRPTQDAAYLGGAAVIAAHLKAMGAEPHLVTAVADDDASRELSATLAKMGVEHTALPFRGHAALPTKQRFLVDGQKVLKVDRGDAKPLDSEAERRVMQVLSELRTSIDGVIFADFGYGTVTTPLLSSAAPLLRPHARVMAGDVSGLRRTLLSMNNFDLLTPTERELRAVAGDLEGSLPSVAGAIMQKLHAKQMCVTMGGKGCVLFHPRESDPAEWFHSRLRTEHIPPLAEHVRDVIGGGDALLAAATLALLGGASIQQAGYLGAAAAAVAVSRVGNLPVGAGDLLAWLRRRPELTASAAVA